MAPCPSILNLGTQFIQVISQAQQKNLRFYPRQKPLEFVIVFQHPKGSFYLARTVHSILDFFLAQDVFIGFLALFQEILREIPLFVPFDFYAFPFVQTAAAVFTFIYHYF